MKIRIYVVLAALILWGCRGEVGNEEDFFEVSRVIDLADADYLVDYETDFIGGASLLVNIDDERFGIYDRPGKKLVIMYYDGEFLYKFGEVGDGPGEWHSMSGVGAISFFDGNFWMTDRRKSLFLRYNERGQFIEQYSLELHQRYSDTQLLGDNQVLIATAGHNDALLGRYDLSKNLEIQGTIGEPLAEPDTVFNMNEMEDIRTALTRGELHPRIKNDLMFRVSDESVFVFLTSYGELRKYSHDDELIWSVSIPNKIINEYTLYSIDMNMGARPHSFFNPDYAVDIQITDELIYILTATDGDSDDPKLPTYILTYTFDGDLAEVIELANDDEPMYLLSMLVRNNNQILLTNVLDGKVYSVAL